MMLGKYDVERIQSHGIPATCLDLSDAEVRCQKRAQVVSSGRGVTAHLSLSAPFSDSPIPPDFLIWRSCSQGGIYRQPLHLVT